MVRFPWLQPWSTAVTLSIHTPVDPMPLSPAAGTALGTCVFVLSTKSAGSSVLQRVLVKSFGASLIRHTRHFENETLYWTKAASVLGLPQVRLPRSEVPLPADRARRELDSFVAANAPDHAARFDDVEGLVSAFEAVCRATGPIVVEKSPHHLYEAAALDLIVEFARRSQAVDVRFVGLIRNPVDTCYSTWRRFGIPPRVEERFWCLAGENLLALRNREPERTLILRYEDLASGRVDLNDLAAHLRLDPVGSGLDLVDRDSLQRWREDTGYAHFPAPDTVALAGRLGYEPDELDGRDGSWPLRARVREAAYDVRDRIPQSLLKATTGAYRALFRRRG
jgi:hypothetical protein